MGLCRKQLLFATTLLCGFGPAWAADPPRALADMSLEELGNLKVTSVSKSPERLADAPASIYVISREEIRRSGATSLPEALRLAPNLQVAQISSYGYAISSRGMNGSSTSAPNKMLVMINGRSVYSPLFSGVFWDAQDLVLEDVERIEVISGPGGTLWGVNAVNAVINIITRSSADTQGPLLSVGAGRPDSQAAFRYGGTFGETGTARGYAKVVNLQHTQTDAGIPVDDAGHHAQVGFRVDVGGPGNALALSGNAYDGVEGQPAPGAVAVSGAGLVLGDVDFSGRNLTGRWDRSFGSGASLQLQAYYDHTERVVPPTFSEKLDIFDLQLQHSLAPLGAHAVAWGFNVRKSMDRLVNSASFAFLPAHLDQAWTSVFVQDKVALGASVDFTAGARVERNDYTGNEFLPSVRISWRSGPNRQWWAAASRTVRAPSRLDRDAYIPGVPPFLLDGGQQSRSELANVYELGYRAQPTPRLSYSATVYHADYDQLRTLEIAPSLTNYIFGGLMAGHTTGFEAWGKFQATPTWRISAGVTGLRERLHLKPGSNDVTGPLQAGLDPDNTWQLRSSWDIGDSSEFDLGLRHVSALDATAVPAYTAVDARLGWRTRGGLEWAISGRNLTGGHAEYGALDTRAELGRSILLNLVWTR
jgi:iron complex outermembrane receptor protein